MTLSFSIIIPTFQRPHLLKETLSQLLKLKYPQKSFEIIVVNNDPEDHAIERVVSSLQKNARNLKYCTERQRGASPARNRGVHLATHRHLIFIDDDVRVSPQFLLGYQKAWKAYPNARVMGGRLIAKPSNDSAITPTQRQLVEKYDWCFGQLNRSNQDSSLTPGELLYSGNISYRRDRTHTIVFHPALGRYAFGIGRIGAEDYELCTRTILSNEVVMYVADQDITVEHEVAVGRYSETYVAERHFMSGIELALQEHCIRQQFPQFRSFYIEGLHSFEGIKRILFNKHERTMLLSYLLNGEIFASFHRPEEITPIFSTKPSTPRKVRKSKTSR